MSHVVFDGSHKYKDLLLADTTFADATLAAFYGTSAPASGFGEVPSPDDRRGRPARPRERPRGVLVLRPIVADPKGPVRAPEPPLPGIPRAPCQRRDGPADRPERHHPRAVRPALLRSRVPHVPPVHRSRRLRLRGLRRRRPPQGHGQRQAHRPLRRPERGRGSPRDDCRSHAPFELAARSTAPSSAIATRPRLPTPKPTYHYAADAARECRRTAAVWRRCRRRSSHPAALSRSFGSSLRRTTTCSRGAVRNSGDGTMPKNPVHHASRERTLPPISDRDGP